MSRVLMITVDHQSAEVTARMTESLKCIKANSGVSLIIVRNGSISGTAGNACFLCESVDNVWIYESPVNQGYFGGVKQGMEWFQKAQGDLPAWIIVCNNDIRVEQADFFERLSQLDPRGVGVIAPKIISCRTGLNQNPFMVRRPSRRRVGELHFWLKSYYLAFIHEKMSIWKSAAEGLGRRFLRKSNEPCEEPGVRIYAAHGAFLIFNRQFFELGGFLDEGFFLFHEEISIAEICRKIGLAIVYRSELSVLHDEHSTIGRRFTRTTYRYQKQSFQHLMANYLTDLV